MVRARARAALQQLRYLATEARQLSGKRWWRWGNVWFSDTFWTVASYRLSRSAYLLGGKGWSAMRVPLGPILFAVRPWSGQCQIHYRADIGPGLRVMHPTLGIVISEHTIAGKNLQLVGGNCIGSTAKPGKIILGDDVMLGANAVVLGPVEVGNRARVGAGAVVRRNVPDDGVVTQPDATIVTRPARTTAKAR